MEASHSKVPKEISHCQLLSNSLPTTKSKIGPEVLPTVAIKRWARQVVGIDSSHLALLPARAAESLLIVHISFITQRQCWLRPCFKAHVSSESRRGQLGPHHCRHIARWRQRRHLARSSVGRRYLCSTVWTEKLSGGLPRAPAKVSTEIFLSC